MLSKDKLIYLLKNESIFPLNNDKRYKGLSNDILHEFGEFDKIPQFFSIFGQKTKTLVNIWCSDVIKI